MIARAIRSILVAGDGIVGLSAALAFSRALPQVRVTILSLPQDPAALADGLPGTLPAVGRFHAAIGFDELELVRAGIAHHHLGTRFEGWGPAPWIHSFGEVGRGEGAVPFHPLWLRAHDEGRALPYDRYDVASVFGDAGKFVHPSHDPASPLSTYLYGLRLDPDGYRARLNEAARNLRRLDGDLLGIERRDDGSIAALRLSGDRREEADLFLDCTGPRALLLSEIDGSFEDWSGWLPVCHVAVDRADGGIPDPLNHVRRKGVDWIVSGSVPGATLTASVSPHALDHGAPVHPGARVPFRHNVLALGDAAVAVDPLHGINLSLAHSAILRAIDLLPGRNFNPLELAEYNRLTALETGRARDFLALHYLGRAEPPNSLARTLEQWRARGRLPFFEEELFTPSSWAQALIGLGILPDAIAPTALGVDADAAATAMDRLAKEIAGLRDRLPTYPDYLAQMANVGTAGARR